MVDAERKLNETTAGKAIYSRFKQLQQAQNETLRQLTDQARLQHDPDLAKSLEVECRKVEAQLKKTSEEVEQLKIPFSRRLVLRLLPKKSRAVVSVCSMYMMAAHVDSFI